jgi:alpha-N-arabinofuranosidase
LDARTVKGRILTSGRLQDYNSFEQPEKIKPLDFKSASLKNNSLSFTIPAFSVVVLEINK